MSADPPPLSTLCGSPHNPVNPKKHSFAFLLCELRFPSTSFYENAQKWRGEREETAGGGGGVGGGGEDLTGGPDDETHD